MAKPSLAARAAPGAQSTAIAAQGVGDLFTPNTKPLVDDGGATTYATFISPRSNKWPVFAVQIPGLQESDVVLVRPKPDAPVKLSPFTFFLLNAAQFWTVETDDGGILEAWETKPAGRRDAKERIESAILAIVGDTLVPARMTFKTTKCGAIKTAAAALEAAAGPNWGELSPAHKDSLGAPQPHQRFTATVGTSPKTSRSSGYKYYQATATISPLAPSTWKPYETWLGDSTDTEYQAARQSSIIAIRDAYNDKVAAIQKIADDTAA